eukprot:1066929-Amphidinium_carterae.2
MVPMRFQIQVNTSLVQAKAGLPHLVLCAVRKDANLLEDLGDFMSAPPAPTVAPQAEQCAWQKEMQRKRSLPFF